MTGLIACARMYAMVPGAAEAWRVLFAGVAVRSGIRLDVIDHAFPAPLIELWTRPDLGCAFMCGWPFVRGVADVVPVAAPVLADARAAGRPVYWTDLVVRTDSAACGIENLRGQRVAYTVRDSQSGFNALRHHLRGIPGAKPLFGAEVGPVFTPRRAIEAVVDRRAHAAPIDSIAHALLRLHDPALAVQVRVVAQTEATAAPLLVAGVGADPGAVRALRTALLGLHQDAEGRAVLARLALRRFTEPLPHAEYHVMEDRARDAEAAGIDGLE